MLLLLFISIAAAAAAAAAAADGGVSEPECPPFHNFDLRSPVRSVGGQRCWYGRPGRDLYFWYRRKSGTRLGRCNGSIIPTLHPTKHAKLKPMGLMTIVPEHFVRFEKRVLQGKQCCYFLTWSDLFLSPSFVLRTSLSSTTTVCPNDVAACFALIVDQLDKMRFCGDSFFSLIVLICGSLFRSAWQFTTSRDGRLTAEHAPHFMFEACRREWSVWYRRRRDRFVGG